MRAYLKDRRHAKACIGCTGIPGAPGTAIVGSTSCLAAGFAGNTELNYPVIHGGDVAEIRGWSERLWQEGEPVTDRVVEQLRASWPLAVPAPYLMCLKILYELYGDALGDDAGPAAVELTDFRQDAVAAGLAMLERRNGCCIADVVGRGKTCIGAEIRRRLAIKDPQAGDPLVVCLPRRSAMWERICDRFGLDNAAVVSMSRLTAANYAADRARRKMLRGAGPTLIDIDEAHNFRSNSQRRRTVPLSATPQNLGPRDILRQLELFPDPVHHGLAGIAGDLRAASPTLRTPRLTSGPAKRCDTCCCAAAVRTSSATTWTAN